MTYKSFDLDNRDPSTTTLHVQLDDMDIDVDPIELFTNMIENCYPGHKGRALIEHVTECLDDMDNDLEKEADNG